MVTVTQKYLTLSRNREISCTDLPLFLNLHAYPGQRISKQRTPSKRTLDSAFQKSVPPKTVPRTAHFSVSENPTVPLDSVPPCPLNTWTVPHDSAFQLLEKPNRTPFCVPPGTKMGTVPPPFSYPLIYMRVLKFTPNIDIHFTFLGDIFARNRPYPQKTYPMTAKKMHLHFMDRTP